MNQYEVASVNAKLEELETQRAILATRATDFASLNAVLKTQIAEFEAIIKNQQERLDTFALTNEAQTVEFPEIVNPSAGPQRANLTLA